MSHTRFHRCIIALMNIHGFDGGLKELSKITGIKYRTLWSRAQKPREIRMYEYFGMVEEVGLTGGEAKELMDAIQEG